MFLATFRALQSQLSHALSLLCLLSEMALQGGFFFLVYGCQELGLERLDTLLDAVGTNGK